MKTGKKTASVSQWPVVALGQLCEFLDFRRVPVSQEERLRRIAGLPQDRLYPYYGANGQTGWIDGFLFDGPAILLAEDGGNFGSSTRPLAYAVDGRYWVNNHAHILKPREDVVTFAYLKWALSIRPDVGELVAGSTRGKLTQAVAASIGVPLPPLADQKRIVAKLNEQMAALDRAEKALAEQQAAASALWQAELEAVFDLAANPAWSQVRLGDVAELNPRRPVLHRSDAAPTTFVPMSAIDSLAGTITGSEKRQYGDVKKGYTYFAEGDVLFAKITPCMQNGKHAMASDLVDGIGFGSTEFHVIRPSSALTAEWLHLFVRQQNVLQRAVAHFTGAVGQQRVPQDYVESLILPLPPVSEQLFLSEHLTEIRAQLSALKTALENNNAVLGQLRSRLLDAAFSGEI